MIENVGRFVHFALQSLVAALGAFRRPREVLRQLHINLIGSLPLGLVTGLALGVVVWMHLRGVVDAAFIMRVPEYLALAVVLEFAPMGAGLVVAGRSGASLAAELGSMRLTEQIDALEVLGISPIRLLVGPRVLAMMLTLPLLTVFVGLIAIAGSFVAELLGGSIHATAYELAVWKGLEQGKFVPSTLKTAVFGFLIGVNGCWCGMNTSGGTEGVGRAATQGVVGSTLLVLVSDVVLVKLVQLFA